jgi:preprotein translocase subunit SecY
MKNLDLIIFTIVLVILFGFFFVATIAEFNKMANESYDKSKDNVGGVKALKNFIGGILIGSEKK